MNPKPLLLKQTLDVNKADGIIWWPMSEFGRFSIHVRTAGGSRTDGIMTLVGANDQKDPQTLGVTFAATLGLSAIINSCYAFVGLKVTTPNTTTTWSVDATLLAQGVPLST